MRRLLAAAPTKGAGALRAPPPFLGSYCAGAADAAGVADVVAFHDGENQKK